MAGMYVTKDAYRQIWRRQGMQDLRWQLNIVNVVATAQVNQFVDLGRLAVAEGFRYDPAIYQCAYLKDHGTKGKVSIFSSGKMISYGTKSFEAASRDLNYASTKLAELGLISRVRVDAKLQNIVATGDLGKPVDLEK